MSTHHFEMMSLVQLNNVISKVKILLKQRDKDYNMHTIANVDMHRQKELKNKRDKVEKLLEFLNRIHAQKVA